MSKLHINIFILLISLSLVSCSEKNVVTASLKMPLYRECVETVVDYEKYLTETIIDSVSGYHFEIEIEYFDKLSYAQPSIIGYITILSYGEIRTYEESTNFESLEIRANGIMAECFPESIISFNVDSTNLTVVNNLIQNNRSKGIDNNYLLFDGNELNVYFNDQRYNLPD